VIKVSLKELLGLETFRLSDSEIMRAISNARSLGQEEVVFSSAQNKVVVSLSKVNPKGVISWNWMRA
jgi:hypothetical protein